MKLRPVGYALLIVLVALSAALPAFAQKPDRGDGARETQTDLAPAAADRVAAPLAGSIGSYTFSNSTTPYTALTGATTFAINGGGGNADDGYSAALTIPFSFEFGPNTYTQLRVTSNGWLQFGTGTPVTNAYSALADSFTSNVIAFVSNDLNNTGAVYSYVTTGSAPNRIFKIQAANFYEYNFAPRTGNAQVWLYETTNAVEIYYGTFARNWSSDNTAQVGLKGTSTASTDVRSLSGSGATTWTNPTASNSSNATMLLSGATMPDSGRAYTFTPPIPVNLTASTKSASRGTVRTGQALLYTIVVNNSGTAAATNVTMVDPIPTGTTYVAGSVSANASYNSATNTIQFGPATVNAGTSVTITFSVTATATSGTLTNTATINASNIGAPVTRQATTTALAGSGTDGTYSYIDSLIPGGPTYSFLDATGGTLLIGTGFGLLDDAEANVTMPFSINYYGTPVSQLRVGNNGAILMNATVGEVPADNTAMASAPANFVAPLWDDLFDDTGGVYAQTFGAAPNRIFVVEWFNRFHYELDAPSAVTFEAQFFEGTNEIRFVYQDVDFGATPYNNGASATVGIKGNTIQYSFDQAVLQNNLAIRLFQGPLDVELASFQAEGLADHVRVTWETVSELDNAGFNLLRGPSADGPTEQLNEALIPSQAPGSGQGFVYQWFDETVEPGTTYFYWLDAVDVQGGTTRHGPVSATVSPPTAVTVEALRATEDLTGFRMGSALAALGAALLAALGWRRRGRR